MTDENEKLIAQAIDSAEEVVDSIDGLSEKPRLLVERCDPDDTVAC
jgi:hypothetical protein